MSYADAVDTLRQVLAEQGFGVLTEIDVRATLREKRGVEMEDYVILGVCNPDLAHQALEVDRSIGVLLPCTVVVRAQGEGAVVHLLDPGIMAELTQLEELQPIADEAGRRLEAVLTTLTRS
jgi:uncharacterized protein (DUF302 family)